MPRTPSPSSQFAKWLANVPTPVYWVDGQRRIRFANDACVQWIGVDVERLSEVPCNYHSQPTDDRLQSLAADLCPPPTAFEGAMQGGRLTIHTATGELSRRAATFVPLVTPNSDASAVIVIVGDQELAVDGDVSDQEAITSEELHRVLQAWRNDHDGRPRVDALSGSSPSIRRAREQMRAAIESRARTVIVGPTGSGKEQMARAVFRRRAPDSRIPLLPLACPSLDGDAIDRTISGFLAADLGDPATLRTLLLLDADQLTIDAQQALAQLVFSPRVVFTTLATATRSLVTLAAEGRFRADLSEWLTTLEVRIPPLASRREDIPLAAQLAVELANARSGRQRAGLSAEALDALAAYTWPGNFRQLVELIEQACDASEGAIVTIESLPEVLRHAAVADAHPSPAQESLRLDDLLLDVEREVLVRAIRKTKGNRAKAARLLGISRPRLLRRLEQLKIEDPKSSR